MSDVTIATHAATLIATLNQNKTRNGVLLDLCRSSCCAMNAPGQPQAKPNSKSVFSGMRHLPEIAADLSMA
jgi:hypothetical protein